MSQSELDIDLSFCPLEYVFCLFRLLGNRQGGCPRFNNDGKSDTPSFVSKYTVNIKLMQDRRQIDSNNFQEHLKKVTYDGDTTPSLNSGPCPSPSVYETDTNSD